MTADIAGTKGNATASIENGNCNHEAADFEKAVAATEYGLFNILLIIAAIPICWTTTVDTTTSAFILAAAECELELTIMRKGLLIASPFIAMILTSFIWEFVTDRVGRRTLLLCGLLVDAVCNVANSTVKSYHVFLLITFISGAIAGGPLATSMTYLTEFHGAHHRPRLMMWGGLLFALVNIAVAALAYGMAGSTWTFTLFDGLLSYTQWRIYLLICSIPSVLGFLLMIFLPESPKYLMTEGKHEEALKILRRMYWMNTRKPADTFPIKALLWEKTPTSTKGTNSEKIRTSWTDAKRLFAAPYLTPFLLIVVTQFGGMFGLNMMRLWTPQIFVILNTYVYEDWYPIGGRPTMCEILDFEGIAPRGEPCVARHVEPNVYLNSTIIATSAVFVSFFIDAIVKKLSKRSILFAAFFLSAASSMAANWAQYVPFMLTFYAVVIVTSRVACSLVGMLNADIVPISMRATAVRITTLAGRIGAFTGTLIFPSFFLYNRCLIGFISFGAFFFVCALISFFIRKTSKRRQIYTINP